MFEDAKRRKDREVKRIESSIDSECTFSPNIKLTQKFKPIFRCNTKSSLTRNRLKNNNSELDLKTGKPFYHPQIGRPPKNRSRSKAESIGEYLYNITKRKMKRSTEDENSLQSSVSFTQDKSNQLIEKMRKTCFTNIFNKLDSDRDGIISQQCIDINELPKGILKIYDPVLSEMNYMNCTLNLKEFISASSRLFKELTILQKNELMQFCKDEGRISKDCSYEDCTFKVRFYKEIAID